MYSMNRKEVIKPDFEMMERIIGELNEKFDPKEMYHHSSNRTEMFEFQFKSDDKRREAWQIVFMGVHTVLSGGQFGFDYEDCQEEEYLTLEAKNERKILMLAVNGTINIIDNFISYVAFSDASVFNKQKWISTIKKSMEEE